MSTDERILVTCRECGAKLKAPVSALAKQNTCVVCKKKSWFDAVEPVKKGVPVDAEKPERAREQFFFAQEATPATPENAATDQGRPEHPEAKDADAPTDAASPKPGTSRMASGWSRVKGAAKSFFGNIAARKKNTGGAKRPVPVVPVETREDRIAKCAVRLQQAAQSLYICSIIAVILWVSSWALFGLYGLALSGLFGALILFSLLELIYRASLYAASFGLKYSNREASDKQDRCVTQVKEHNDE